jgi:hypothetical protein
MPSYPYNKNISYPDDPAHTAYQKKYNTRKVTDDAFKNALKTGSFAGNAK